MGAVYGASSFSNLVLAEMRKSFQISMRYKVESILSFLFLLALFFGVLMGVRVSSGEELGLGDGNESFLIGFMCWLFVTGGLTQVANCVEEESKTGTLEPLFMSSYHPVTIFLARSFSSLAIGIPALAILFVVLYFASGSSLHLSHQVILPLISIDLTANGIGFFLGGLALLLKRVRMILVLAQIAAIAAMLPHDGVQISQILTYVFPIVPGIDALRSIMVDEKTLGIDTQLALLVNGLLYLAIGIIFFMASINIARKRGSLGQY